MNGVEGAGMKAVTPKERKNREARNPLPARRTSLQAAKEASE